MPRAPAPSEDDLHKLVARALEIAIAPPGVVYAEAIWFTIEMRTSSKHDRLERAGRGVIGGVPDIAIIFKGAYHAIELKSASGRPSTAQRTLHPQMRLAGVRLAVAYSLDEVFAVLRAWDIPHRRLR